MNSKKIKELRWHKKVLIGTIEETGIHIEDIGAILDSIINNLDEMRQEEDPVNVARNEGFSNGFVIGRTQGHSEGMSEAMDKVLNDDLISKRIKIVERTMCGSVYYNVYIDGSIVGYRFSYDEAITLGEDYIENEVTE